MAHVSVCVRVKHKNRIVLSTVIVTIIILFLNVSPIDGKSENIESINFPKLRCLSSQNKNNPKQNQNDTIAVNDVLTEGQHLYGDSGLITENIYPCWMDLKLVRIGQNFARENLAQMASAHFIALVMLLPNAQLRRALYSTGISETPFKAFERYAATGMQVQLWYRDDILSPNWIKSVTTVRTIHDKAGQIMKKKNLAEEFSMPLVTKDNNPDGHKVNSYMWDAFQLDLENGWKRNIIHIDNTTKAIGHEPSSLFNQYLMSLTQWAFVSLPIIRPTRVGIPKWTDLELKGFAHLWAVISYALGTDENYIMCKDPNDMSGCTKYLTDMLDTHMVPGLYNIDFEGQVILEALLKSSSFVVPGTPTDYFLIKILEDILEIPAHNMNRRSDWRTRIGRYFSKNWVLPLNYSPLVKRASNTGALWVMKWVSILAFGDPGTNFTKVANDFYVF